MFEGEKTLVFWAGLIILALASLVLFALAWNVVIQWTAYSQYNLAMLFSSWVPFIVGAVVFILIGGWMMKSGVRR